MRRLIDVVDIAAQQIGPPARGVAGHQAESVMRVQVAEPVGEIGERHAEQPRHGVEDLDIIVVLVARVAGHAPVAVARAVGAGGDLGIAGVESAVLAARHLFRADVKDAGLQFAETCEPFACLVVVLDVIAGPGAEPALAQDHVAAGLDIALPLMQAHAVGTHLVLAGLDAHVAGGRGPAALLVHLEFVRCDLKAGVGRLPRQRHHSAALRKRAFRQSTGRHASQTRHKDKRLHCCFAIGVKVTPCTP